MVKLNKTAAVLLTLSLVLTGCSQKLSDKSRNGTTDHPAQNETYPQDPDQPSASSSDSEARDYAVPEKMLLEHDVQMPKAVGNKETAVSILLNGAQGVELFSHDQKNNIYQYVLSNDKWEKHHLQFPSRIKESAGLNRLEMLRGEDGRYYAFYALSDETYHLEVTDDLSDFEEITPPQWREPPGSRGYVIPSRIRISNDGVLCALLKYEDICRMYDLKNGGNILDYEFGISSYESVTICMNYLFSETIGSRGNVIYDIAAEKHILELDSCPSNNAVYEMVSPEELYACNDNGIYTLSNKKWQLLADSSLNLLSDPNYSWRDMRHIGERLYITYQPTHLLTEGRSKEGFLIKYYEYSTDLPKIDTTLTIWGLEENTFIKSVLAVFRKEHPTVRVVYEIAADTSGVKTTDDIIREFNAGMFAGNGPDLLLMDGLHIDTYAQRGLLYNLTDDLASLKPQLLPGVQALIDKNSYAVPLRVSLPFIIGEKEILTDSLDDFLEKSSQKRTCELTPENIFDICSQFFSEGLALNKAEPDKDSSKEDLVLFLELCQKAAEAWPCTDSPKFEFDYNSGRNGSALGLGNIDFTFSYAHGLYQFSDMLDSIDQLSEKGFDFHCAGQAFIPTAMLAINQQSPNISLSVEFLQKALDIKLQESDLSDGFPVHTKALDSWADHHSNLMIAVGDNEGNKWDTQWPSKETLTRFLQRVKQADHAVFIERYIQELVKTEALNVIAGDASPEDAAGRILNQLELYYED